MSETTFYGRLLHALARTWTIRPEGQYATGLSQASPPRRLSPIVYFISIFAAAIAVSAILIGVAVSQWQHLREPTTWLPSSALNKLETADSSAHFLSSLAKYLETWKTHQFDNAPPTYDDQKRLLGELYDGCLDLLASDLKPLTGEVRRRLKDRCRTWLDLINEQCISLAESNQPQTTKTAAEGLLRSMLSDLQAESAKDFK